MNKNKSKFEEWFEKFDSNLYSIPENKVYSRKAWNACKKEVLKILDNANFSYENYADIREIKDKIKNL